MEEVVAVPDFSPGFHRISPDFNDKGGTHVGDLSYAYDTIGRRTSMGGTLARVSLPSATTASAAYNVNNQLTSWNGSTLSYDLNGNMTSDGIRSYTWSARNQLMAIGTTAFQYDGYGRRSQNGAGVSFVYDGLNPVQEIVGGSVRANLVTGGLDEYFGRTDSGGTSSFITDALGSTLALADSTGTVQTQYTFDPFGNTTTTGSSTNVIEYTGRENDGSGMYYYRARYYNAALHRFISEDPLGFGGGEANFYMYTGDSPTNFIDPLGLDKKNLLKCASEFASRYSIAGGLQRFGIGTSGVGGFITNALGGNAVSGLSDLGQSIFTGEGGGHNVFYNMGQGVAAGPTQGFGAAFGKSIKGTPWASGPVDVATDALVKQGFSLATGAGQTIQTLNGVTELGSIGLEVGEFATGFGEVKLAYDVGSYFLGLAKCAAQ